MTLNALAAARAIRKEVSETQFGLVVNRQPDTRTDGSAKKGTILNLVCPDHQYQLTAYTSAEILEGLKLSAEVPLDDAKEEVYSALDEKLKGLPIKMECTESEEQLRDRIVEDGQEFSDVNEEMNLECTIACGNWPKEGTCVMGNFDLDYLVPKEARQRIHEASAM